LGKCVFSIEGVNRKGIYDGRFSEDIGMEDVKIFVSPASSLSIKMFQKDARKVVIRLLCCGQKSRSLPIL
jgi:hypothetical protein